MKAAESNEEFDQLKLMLFNQRDKDAQKKKKIV